MFVITAIVGNSFRNDRSLSSASATISSPRPSRALLPNALRRPPITAVGSRPARSSISAIIDVLLADVRRVVPDRDADAQHRQPIGRRRALLVRAADDVAEIGEQFGNPAHADSADPDKVHVTRLAQQRPVSCRAGLSGPPGQAVLKGP